MATKTPGPRELAEFAVVEYEQGTARQDEAKVAGEVFQANQDFERAHHDVEVQKDRLAHVKESSTDAIARLANSMLIKDRLRMAVRRETDAAEVLDEAESRRRLLLEKIKPCASRICVRRSRNSGLKSTYGRRDGTSSGQSSRERGRPPSARCRTTQRNTSWRSLIGDSRSKSESRSSWRFSRRTVRRTRKLWRRSKI